LHEIPQTEAIVKISDGWRKLNEKYGDSQWDAYLNSLGRTRNMLVYLQQRTSYAVFSLAGVFLVFTGFLLLALLKYWKDPLLTASDQPMNAFIVVCAMGFISSSVLFVLQATRATCLLRWWLPTMFFTGMFGSVFAKSLRIYKIFTNTNMSLRKDYFNQQYVIKILGRILFVALAVLAVSQSLPGHAYPVETQLTTNTKMLSCSTSNIGSGLLLCYIGVLVMAAAVIGFQSRKIPSAFSESQTLFVAIYNILIIIIVGFPFNTLLDGKPNAQALLRCTCMNMAAAFLLVPMYGKKLYYVLQGEVRFRFVLFCFVLFWFVI
jgi:hypothetical protein